jgi:hypothetical protein
MNEEAGVIEGTLTQEVTDEEYETMQSLADSNVTEADITPEQSKILADAVFGKESEQ